MRKKDYNSGTKMGIKLSENIVERDTKAIQYLSSQVEKLPGQFDDIKSIISQLSSNFEDMEVEKLYGIIKTVKPEDLEYEEKVILLKLIIKTTSSFPPNDNQKQFLRRLCRYLGININDTIYGNYENTNLGEVIDSIRVQKAMYQIVKEYLYLGENTHDYGNKYDRIFNCFSKAVDNESTEILINIKVSIFGIECLYEQYGDDILEPESTMFTETWDLLKSTKVMVSISAAIMSDMLNNSSIVYMMTADFKTQLQEGKIVNQQLASYVSVADEGTKFVYGLKNKDNGKYIIIFVWEGLFIQLEDNLIYIRYSEIFGVEENKEQLMISLYHGYLVCGEELQDIEARQISVTKDNRNRRLTRPIRKAIEGVIEAYDGCIPDTEYAVKIIITERIGKISKSSPTYSADDAFENEKVSKKLDNALAKYAVKVRRNDAIAFIDTSLFGNGGDGLLFSCDGIAFDYAFEKVFLKYDEIKSMAFDKKHKNLKFKGVFSERKNNDIQPSINDICYNLDELRECIEEIRYLI